MYATRSGAQLELRDSVAQDAWQPVCEAPCFQRIRVAGMEARVAGRGMTPSNVFRIEPGLGVARLRVIAGSASSHRLGMTLLVAGIPMTVAGFTAYGLGDVNDHVGLKAAGAVGVGMGAAAVLAAIPLLNRGATRVRDDRGRRIAIRGAAPRF